jgi:glucose/arabinose dehydrogenase
VSDPQFGSQRACSTTEPPVLKVGPHVAAVGMMFYTGSMFPATYKNAAIIAQHGSWDRSTPSGYRVMAARTDGRNTSSFEPLVDGFLPKGRAPSGRGAGAAALGRPVDVLQMPDGSILISDDSGNRLIRISYGTAATANTAGPASVPQNTQQTLEVAEYAELPVTGDNKSTNLISGQLARGSILRDEPGGQRFFVNDLNGPLYILNKQTKQVTTYLNFDGTADHAGLFPKFTAAQGFAAGLMNFVFDPDYARNGIFYTLHMENPNTPAESAMPKPGVVPGLNLAGYTTTPAMPTPILPNATALREMVIVEWTDRQIGNTTFEGTAREVFRMQLPGLFHPLNEIIFNPAARPGDPDWRVMYLGIGDSGTGERPGPMRLHAQRLDTLHGKILRIIPMLSEHASTSTVSANGRYRIPNDNPFVAVEGARKEIWALGLRNPHRMTWYVDPARPREAVLLAFNIGLVSWETVMIVRKGANYGYPLREGTQSMSATNGMGPVPQDDMIPVQLSDTVTRGTVKPTYAVAAYPHTAAAGGDAIANGFVYRGKRIPALRGSLVFGDITTGRIWYAQMSEVLAADDGNPLTLAPLHELTTRLRALSEETFRKRGGQGDTLPGFGAVAGRGRVDIRLAEDNDGELYVLTKGDGMIRELRSVR